MVMPQQGRMAAESAELAHADFSERSRVTGEDHAAHAGGRTCRACGRTIRPEQDARRRGEAGWVHDVCPRLRTDRPAVPARGRLRASHTDREQVLDVLKAAFVQGRLDKDEFDTRVGRVLTSRTYADLDALAADIPRRN